MKKIFLALAAVAALASCSKVEATYEPDVEIGFAPVVSNRTKAMQTEPTFPAESFNVWAWYKQLDPGTAITSWQASAQPQQEYIVEKPFAPKGDTGLWSGETATYFWPKIGSLLFAGYYPTTIADQVSYTFNSTENVMKIVNYVPGFVTTNGTHEEDLMYFNMTPASYQLSNVEVEFRHALSWINVVLVKDANTADNAKITVNSVTFTDIIPAGNATVNNSGVDAAKEIQWMAHGTAKPVVVSEDGGHILAKGNTTPLAKQPLFIPQGMTTLVVNYTIASTDGSQFTETKTLPLSGIVTGHSVWKPGKKYTYTITIGTTEILIDPEVAEWEPVNIPVGI